MRYFLAIVLVLVPCSLYAGTAKPTVTTQAVTSVEYTTATGNGDVTNNGGLTITESGTCIKTSSGPTTADTKFVNTVQSGAFATSMTSLTAGQLYYCIAYAINSKGTGYGGEVTFTMKLDGTIAATGTGSTGAGGAATAGGGSQVVATGTGATGADGSVTTKVDGVGAATGTGTTSGLGTSSGSGTANVTASGTGTTSGLGSITGSGTSVVASSGLSASSADGTATAQGESSDPDGVAIASGMMMAAYTGNAIGYIRGFPKATLGAGPVNTLGSGPVWTIR